jgi:hypothetical protein
MLCTVLHSVSSLPAARMLVPTRHKSSYAHLGLPAWLPANPTLLAYRELSGTSQAAPHIAGIAATCILSGACAANNTGLQNLAVIQAAAQERLAQQQPYGYLGDPSTSKGLASQRYYGFLAWSKFWQR